MAKTLTVYREVNGKVEKETVHDVPPINVAAVSYHERLIKTYHELECEGKLNGMSPREKQRTRDIHTYAQDPSYWPPNTFTEDRSYAAMKLREQEQE